MGNKAGKLSVVPIQFLCPVNFRYKEQCSHSIQENAAAHGSAAPSWVFLVLGDTGMLLHKEKY